MLSEALLKKPVGVYIDALTTSENRIIIDDKILKFSKGYIAKYDVIEERQQNEEFFVKYHVYIKTKPLNVSLQDNLIQKKIFDFDDLGISLRTQLNRNKKIYEVLSSFFNDFFNKYPDQILTIVPTNFKVIGEIGLSENVDIKVNYEIMWNQFEIYHLACLLEQVNDKNKKHILLKWFSNLNIQRGKGYDLLSINLLKKITILLKNKGKGYDLLSIKKKKRKYIFPTDNLKDCYLDSVELKQKLFNEFFEKYEECIKKSKIYFTFFHQNKIIYTAGGFVVPKNSPVGRMSIIKDLHENDNNSYKYRDFEGNYLAIGGIIRFDEQKYQIGQYPYAKEKIDEGFIGFSRPDYSQEQMGIGEFSHTFKIPISVIEKFDDIKIIISKKDINTIIYEENNILKNKKEWGL